MSIDQFDTDVFSVGVLNSDDTGLCQVGNNQPAHQVTYAFSTFLERDAADLTASVTGNLWTACVLPWREVAFLQMAHKALCVRNFSSESLVVPTLAGRFEALRDLFLTPLSGGRDNHLWPLQPHSEAGLTPPSAALPLLP